MFELQDPPVIRVRVRGRGRVRVRVRVWGRDKG